MKTRLGTRWVAGREKYFIFSSYWDYHIFYAAEYLLKFCNNGIRASWNFEIRLIKIFMWAIYKLTVGIPETK